MTMRRVIILVFCLLGVMVAAAPAEGQKEPGGRGQGGPETSTFRTDIPDQLGSVVLSRPEENSVGASFLLQAETQAVLVWGIDAEALPSGVRTLSFKAGEPQLVTMDELSPDTTYFYELREASSKKRLLPLTGAGTFHTARPAGSRFTFTITADPHLDENTSPEVYLRTLANALSDGPDFHIDLGDTFMTEKHPSRDSALRQYLAQRYYCGSLCQSAPLFLVLGNHDGESPRGGDGDDLAVWSNAMRKRYFPNPVSDGFYSSNATPHPKAGLLQDYYAWEWGDALFIVLDPYWYVQGTRGQRDNWRRTLGVEQYQWLERTLQESHARFKFVFIHHLVGGATPQGRGGVEAVPYFEWGGRNLDGTPAFRENRPGWTMPIHQLLVQNHVNVVFHGHDHLYAKEELDGIVYQEVPQPGDPRGSARSAAEYGYSSGAILGSSGHLRVDVAPSRTIISYIKVDGLVADSYKLTPTSDTP